MEALGMWEDVLNIVDDETGNDERRLFLQDETWDGSQYIRSAFHHALHQNLPFVHHALRLSCPSFIMPSNWHAPHSVCPPFIMSSVHHALHSSCLPFITLHASLAAWSSCSSKTKSHAHKRYEL